MYIKWHHATAFSTCAKLPITKIHFWWLNITYLIHNVKITSTVIEICFSPKKVSSFGSLEIQYVHFSLYFS